MITINKVISGLLIHAYKQGVDPFTSVNLVRSIGFKDEDIHSSADEVQSIIVKRKWDKPEDVPTILEWMNNNYE